MARAAAVPLRVERTVQAWFAPATDAYARDRFPAFFLDRDEATPPLYGFCDYGLGVKAALHGGTPATAETLDRTVNADDVGAVRTTPEAFMPGAAAFRVIIDTHPHDARIVIAGGFSGHGDNFCCVVGEIVADLTCEGGTRHPIAFLPLDRAALGAAPSSSAVISRS